MKAKMILLSVVMVAAFAANAMAQGLTIHFGDGKTIPFTRTGSMTVDDAGNIDLSVSDPVPAGGNPGTLSLSLSPNSLPAATQGIQYSQSVTMSASGGSGSGYIYGCSGSGVAGITASASGSNGSPCVISGTPTATGTYTVSFNVMDSLAAQAANSVSFNVNQSGGGNTGGATLLAEGPKVSMQIAASGENDFYFTLNRAVSMVQVYITTMDWQTNQDLLVSDVAQPSCSVAVGSYSLPPSPAPWYVVTASSNETVSIRKSFSAGTTIYVTVCNRSNTAGSYAIYWKGY
ncbi:MAG TPA: hypothetical protein VFG09_15155 [Thermodesulfovibrionales bacterium]|nr:hypothetical protein [Thermodesulfovibrionales bacterium]